MKCRFTKVKLGGKKSRYYTVFIFPKVILKKPEEWLDRLMLLTNARTLSNYNYNENFNCIYAHALIICGFKKKKSFKNFFRANPTGLLYASTKS